MRLYRLTFDFRILLIRTASGEGFYNFLKTNAESFEPKPIQLQSAILTSTFLPDSYNTDSNQIVRRV